MSRRTVQRRTKNMSHFEKFVTRGNEKVEELAKAGAMLDEDLCGNESKDSPAGARSGARSFAVRSQLSLLGRRMERL